MTEYRLYVIGPHGRINRIDVHGATEGDAKERAKQLAEGQVAELWESARLIERFEPKKRLRSLGRRVDKRGTQLG